MKAAILRAVNSPLTIEEVDIAEPGPLEVLVRVAAAGVCHSDLSAQQGVIPYPLPTVLGHECAGVVEAIGSGVHLVAPGDHVVTCVSAFCGHCQYCLTGHLALCGSPETRRAYGSPDRLSVDGERIRQFYNVSAFAEQALVHEHACVRVSREIPLDRAAVIGCAVLTGFGAVVRTARIQPGEVIAVIGCGGVGLAAINAASIAGAARVIAIDRVSERLDLARSFGATDTVLGNSDLAAGILSMTRGGVDHSLEAVGTKATVELAWEILRPGGVATIVGVLPAGVKVEIDAGGFQQEKRLQGSLMGSNVFPVDIPRLVDFYLRGQLHLDLLVSHRVALEEINDALENLDSGRSTRSVVVF